MTSAQATQLQNIYNNVNLIMSDERFFSSLPTVDLLDYNGNGSGTAATGTDSVRTIQHGRKISDYKYLYFAFAEAFGVYDADAQRAVGSGVTMETSKFISGTQFSFTGGSLKTIIKYNNDTSVKVTYTLSNYRQYFLFGIKAK